MKNLVYVCISPVNAVCMRYSKLENKQNFKRLGITTLFAVRAYQSFAFHKVQVQEFPCFLRSVCWEHLHWDTGFGAHQTWPSVDEEVGRHPPWKRGSESWIYFLSVFAWAQFQGPQVFPYWSLPIPTLPSFPALKIFFYVFDGKKSRSWWYETTA